jgi:Tol biopolymer transport system component
MRSLRFILIAVGLVVMFLGAGCSEDEWRGFPPEFPPGLARYDYHDPAWSPTGEYIAYKYVVDPTGTLDTCGLYVYDLVNSTAVRLITSNSRVPMPYMPDFSPDGRWIAFSWYNQIWKCLVTADSLVQLTSGGEDFEPAWSPDGQRIAYFRAMSGIHIMNSDGSGDTLVVGGRDPQWLGERRIVFVGLYQNLFVFDLETGVEKLIFERPSDWVGDSVRELDADHTGTRLLFSGWRPGEPPNVWRLDLETSRLTQLTTTGGDEAAWSPDGTEIVYTNTQLGRIWLMAADGSNKRPLFKG